jgi:CubicO group peptidase (beta-lactamase class C family)
VTDIEGIVAPGFERVRETFEANFVRFGDVGAACCVYVDGQPVVDLAGGVVAPGGAPYTRSTLQMVASATKGALAICALRLAERGELDLDAPVARYWPEFAEAGKATIPVRWLLSHRAGLPYVDTVLPMSGVYEWQRMVDLLAAQDPVWTPGEQHGYHALTYGWLVGEVLRRVTGSTPGELIRHEIADPLGVDFWVGLPAAETARVSPLIVATAAPETKPDAFTLMLFDSDSFAHKAFFVPNGLLGSMNDPDGWAAQVPAANGMATARSLARMYAACLGEVDGVRLLSPATLRAATTEESGGRDAVLQVESRFGLGFQLSYPLRPFAGDGSFGHYGLGGSVGFGHSAKGVAFGYVVNQMLPGGVVDPRSTALIEAVFASV